MKIKPKTQVLSTPAARPEEAVEYFTAKGRYETDIADVAFDLQEGIIGFTIIDVRDAQSYEEAHLPGALSLPFGQIKRSTLVFPKGDVLVLYCWGPACNGASKAAAKLAALGYPVKEMIGGIEYWRKEGGSLEGTLGDKAPIYWNMH
ncbi:rhodanese-like domain-containing protein [Paenibacillus monticola]|uniref:Rhodanese-like domain-containing protein n=1 Tax=Paenibacillus monticola TaxID=2666075 RepID=A0A7X2H8B4_9BACL|nr:rhodanese-like domain-containing protein [Paenibacillus monticola]MRN55320.1 rhodanese-like domain-containing protein [Paenibacillus monticola]